MVDRSSLYASVEVIENAVYGIRKKKQVPVLSLPSATLEPVYDYSDDLWRKKSWTHEEFLGLIKRDAERGWDWVKEYVPDAHGKYHVEYVPVKRGMVAKPIAEAEALNVHVGLHEDGIIRGRWLNADAQRRSRERKRQGREEAKNLRRGVVGEGKVPHESGNSDERSEADSLHDGGASSLH